MKFKNFPRVTCISLKESVERRTDLITQLENRGIYNHKIIECFDGRSTNYQDNPIVTGPYLRETPSEVIATSMSHINAIHDWYTTTGDDIGFFCEDDIKFDIGDNWNFTWDEFVSRLPSDWKIMQLALIRTSPLGPEDMKLHTKKWDDWSCCAYLINRPYAKQLLEDYYPNGIFTLDIKDTNHIPIPENIIYTSYYQQSYTIPLFTENRKHKSTLIREETYDQIEKIQSDSCSYIIDWWETKGNKLTLDELLATDTHIDIGFDWGNSDVYLANIINEEIFQNRIYEKYVQVKENDIVLDIGANVGAFTYSILEKNPKKVICVEPSNTLIKTLTKNVAKGPISVDIVNAAVGTNTGAETITDQVVIYKNEGDKFNSITFKDLISLFKLDRIDFMKIDCEGGEYSVFTKENKDYILNNISHISGEFHIWGFDNVLEKFIDFRELYLKDHKNYKIFDRYDNDITDLIWDNTYLKQYADYHTLSAQFIIYMSNEKKETLNMNKKIPVIGTAVVNNTYWVSRLLMSVDYPVETFVIINNNGRGIIDEELNNLTKIKHKFIDNIKVVHMPANIGCSGAWNLIIKCYMNAPYWIIVNDDVAFNPGLLEEMADIANGNENIGMVHPNTGDFDIGAWDLFLIRDFVIKQFGLFDENCYPAYCEDADYIMRLSTSPIQKVIGTKNSYQHGHADSKDYYNSGSQTVKSEEGLKEKLDKSNNDNIEYLTKKWGPGWRTVNPTSTPFQGAEHHIGETRYDLDFVRSKHLGF